MEKINVAEILKKYPEGTILYSPVFGECKFVEVFGGIKVIDRDNSIRNFYQDGRYHELGDCVLFPSKDQRDWSKFQRPFKDGDIISDSLGTCIFKRKMKGGTVDFYCGTHTIAQKHHFKIKENPVGHYGYIDDYRFATEEEKALLFKVIEENGYRWNPETKTLEKLIKPKFKIGDRIESLKFPGVYNTVTKVCEGFYLVNSDENEKRIIQFDAQHNWELVSDKFDISTLIPFETKVLVRNTEESIWKPAIFGCYVDNTSRYYVLGGTCWSYCIPYKGNEHLRGKTDDCDKRYKTWE